MKKILEMQQYIMMLYQLKEIPMKKIIEKQ